MLSYERQNQIIDILKERRSATVELLARQLFVSCATIRRDLAEMDKKRLICRVRGGAALVDGNNTDAPLLVRSATNREKKEQIASLALPLIQNGSTLLMDSSSTVTALARRLDAFYDITVVTNGMVTLSALNEIPTVKLFCCGGLLHNNSSFTGQTAIDAVQSFRADILIFSCCGLSASCGPTEASEQNAAIKRAMLKSAKKRVLLCDSTKFDDEYFCRVCELNEIDTIVTDTRPAEAFLSAYRGELIYERS